MEICFTINSSYIGQCMVTIYSIVKNTKSNFIFHILQNDFSISDKDKISKFAIKLGIGIMIHFVDDSMFKGLIKMSYDNGYTAYYRLLIPFMKFESKKVLYMDSDIIVKGDIKDIFELETNHFIMAALDSNVMRKKEHVQVINGTCKEYFNSGVILFNFDYTNEIEPINEIKKYITKSSKNIIYHDQDILNHLYCNKFSKLPKKYNSMQVIKSIGDLFGKGNKNDIVLHYVNWKPWNNNYIGKNYKSYRKVYNEVSKLSELDFLEKRKLRYMIRLIAKYIIKK